jgi:hypothetical protein
MAKTFDWCASSETLTASAGRGTDFRDDQRAMFIYLIPTLKALNKPLNNDPVKPFHGIALRFTRFPACYAWLNYRRPSA